MRNEALFADYVKVRSLLKKIASGEFSAGFSDYEAHRLIRENAEDVLGQTTGTAPDKSTTEFVMTWESGEDANGSRRRRVAFDSLGKAYARMNWGLPKGEIIETLTMSVTHSFDITTQAKVEFGLADAPRSKAPTP